MPRPLGVVAISPGRRRRPGNLGTIERHDRRAYASGYQKENIVFSLFQPEGLGFKSLWHRHRCIMELKGQAVGLRYSKF